MADYDDEVPDLVPATVPLYDVSIDGCNKKVLNKESDLQK